MSKTSFSNLTFELIIIFLLPIALITGPAIPDILAVLLGFYFIFQYRKIKFLLSDQYWLHFFFLIWIIFNLNSFFAYDIKLAFTDSLIFIRFVFFTAFLYFCFSKISTKGYIFFLKYIYILNILIIIDTFYQFYNYDVRVGFQTDLFGILPEGLYGRLSGPFKDLVVGSYLSRFFFFIILFIYLNFDKIKNNRLFYTIHVILLSLNISVIFLSGERMALATTLLGIFICMIFIKKIRLFLIFFSFLSIVFLLFNFQFHPHYQNNKVIKSSSAHEGLLIEKSFKCFENPEKTCYEKFKVQPKFTAIIFDFNNSAYGEIYKTALAMWVDKPITGIGLNNFNESCVNNKKYDKFHKNFPCTSHPHNIYLQSLVEGGLIGLIFFCIFVVLIFHKVSLNKDTGVKIILYSTLLVIFWPIMSTGSFIKNWNMIFICYIIGISLASSNIKLCLNFDSKK